MSVYSMTGFATATSVGVSSHESPASADNLATRPPGAESVGINAELRSVNSRFLDLAFRLPDEFRALEPQLRDLLAADFKRGKIELRLSTQGGQTSAWPRPQPEQLNRLAQLESTIHGWLPDAAPLSVQEILQWCKSGAPVPALDQVAMAATRGCIAGLKEARGREGERLKLILLERVDRLRELASRAEPLVPAIVQRQQERFVLRWREALDASGGAAAVSNEVLQERALTEAAAYAIRIDVAEELARLRAHLDEITRLLRAGGEVGKRLDFLIQELLREANTLSSKSAALEMTQISVEMKVAIEQLREQVQNIE